MAYDTTALNQHNSVLDLIGNTPLVRAQHIDTGACELFLKLESQNPGGSIKDRIALAMVEAAERDVKIKPGATLVEATAGNTGLALALVAAQKGYKLILVIPDKMSQEKIFHLKAMGAQVVMTRSDVEKGHPDYYQDKARKIAEETPGAYFINQFENPANPAAHESGTAPEIWRQMGERIDAVVCGVGSSGTLTGHGRFFAKTAPHVEMVLADPKGSILAPLVNHGTMIKPGSWLVEGIGEDFVPKNCDLSLIKRAYIGDLFVSSLNVEGIMILYRGQPIAMSVWENVDHPNLGKFSNSYVANCHKVRGLSDYLHYRTAKTLAEKGVRQLCLGGAETESLDAFKRKFQPIHSLALVSSLPQALITQSQRPSAAALSSIAA